MPISINNILVIVKEKSIGDEDRRRVLQTMNAAELLAADEDKSEGARADNAADSGNRLDYGSHTNDIMLYFYIITVPENNKNENIIAHIGHAFSVYLKYVDFNAFKMHSR